MPTEGSKARRRVRSDPLLPAAWLLEALRKLKADSTSPFVFVSERGGPLSPDMIARIVERAGEAAKLGFHVHPHMLRHATGYALANQGTDTRLIRLPWPCLDRQHGALHEAGARALGGCSGQVAQALQ